MAVREVDPRIIYLFVALALAAPLIFGFTLKPGRMRSAESLYKVIEELPIKPDEIAFLAVEWGPGTGAENGPQTEVILEHLMRRRIPIALFTSYNQAEPFLKQLPERVAARLMTEQPGEVWSYGKDWVNLGFNPNTAVILQSLSKSHDLVALFKRDALGTPLSQIPAFKNVKTLQQIRFLMQVSSLVGSFETYVSFFQNEDYKPLFGHGCTSITIPQAYIYLDSKQIVGLLEGIAGAAWYAELLKEHYPKRLADRTAALNTSLGVAHLVIILFVILGNLVGFRRLRHA